MSNAKPTATLWVCSDCMHSHANGETGNESPDREPWEALFAREPEGSFVTMGMPREEHECDWAEDPESEAWDTCECELSSFSWSTCEGCGSDLGGERHAFVLWSPEASA